MGGGGLELTLAPNRGDDDDAIWSQGKLKAPTLTPHPPLTPTIDLNDIVTTPVEPMSHLARVHGWWQAHASMPGID